MFILNIMAEKETLPTQEFVEIDRVEDGVVVLKNGSLRRILIVSGVNFDLKSEEEQNIIIAAYQNMLNSLRFSIQFFVHSRRLNIESYLASFGARANEEQNELLRNQINEYVQFVKSFVGQNPIMTKTFFSVVPFDPLILPGAITSAGKKLFGFFKKAAPPEEDGELKRRNFKENVDQLDQRVSQVVSGLTQIGLRAIPLENDEVMDLFYNLYNPESVEKKNVA